MSGRKVAEADEKKKVTFELRDGVGTSAARKVTFAGKTAGRAKAMDIGANDSGSAFVAGKGIDGGPNISRKVSAAGKAGENALRSAPFGKRSGTVGKLAAVSLKSAASTGKAPGADPESIATGARASVAATKKFDRKTTSTRKPITAGDAGANLKPSGAAGKSRKSTGTGTSDALPDEAIPSVAGKGTAARKAQSIGIGINTAGAKASEIRKPDRGEPIFDTSVTWDCSLGRSDFARSCAKFKKSRSFQTELNVNNVFGTCTHPDKEVMPASCGCPNRQSFVICRRCNTLFCDPVNECFNNPRHLQGKEAPAAEGESLPSNIVLEPPPGPSSSKLVQDSCFALQRE